MTRFTDELGWAFRLMRHGWGYMPALEMIRAHPGAEEAMVVAEESAMRVVQVPSALQIHPRTLARYRAIEAELDRLLTPEARQRIIDGDREFTRRFVLGEGS